MCPPCIDEVNSLALCKRLALNLPNLWITDGTIRIKVTWSGPERKRGVRRRGEWRHCQINYDDFFRPSLGPVLGRRPAVTLEDIGMGGMQRTGEADESRGNVRTHYSPPWIVKFVPGCYTYLTRKIHDWCQSGGFEQRCGSLKGWWWCLLILAVGDEVFVLSGLLAGIRGN